MSYGSSRTPGKWPIQGRSMTGGPFSSMLLTVIKFPIMGAIHVYR